MEKKIVLVTGGARSGKSSFAESYAASLGSKVAYIATAQALDAEMAGRIDMHRRKRPADWKTYEAPLDAEQVLTETVIHAGTVLFDCLTLYVSNMLLSTDFSQSTEDRYRHIRKKIDMLLERAQTIPATVIFVTNEVGMGIVPEHPLAREFRDIAGMVNQQVAAAADEVYLLVSGLALEVKKLAVAADRAGRVGIK